MASYRLNYRPPWWSISKAARRPDLAALAARIEDNQAALDLARKQYYPGVDVFGRCDTFRQPANTQSDLCVGVNLIVLLYQNRRHAAVREAMFRVSQRQAEYEQRVADIEYEVQAATEMVEESRRTLRQYSEKSSRVNASWRFMAQSLVHGDNDHVFGCATTGQILPARRST